MNILIYRLGSLGDFVVTIPAFKIIKERHKNDNIILLTNNKYNNKAIIAEDLFPKGIYFDNVIYYPLKLRNIFKLIKLIFILKKLKIDVLYNLNPFDSKKQNTYKYLFFKLIGISKMHGLHLFKENKPKMGNNGLYEKFGEAILRNVGFDINISDIAWSFPLEKEDFDNNLIIKGKYFIFSGGSKTQIKLWDKENWCELFTLLNTYSDIYTAVAIGAEEEFRLNQEILNRWSGKSINLSGKLYFSEIASLLKNADFYIGIDSGLMHLAASVGTKVFAIFSSQDLPGLWFPVGKSTIFYTDIECKGCRLETCKFGNNLCINTISPRYVLKHIVKYIESKIYTSEIFFFNHEFKTE